MTPDIVDRCSWAQLTCWLGADRDRIPQNGEDVSVPSGRDVIAERLAHARGEGPEPTADLTPAALPALAGAMMPPGT